MTTDPVDYDDELDIRETIAECSTQDMSIVTMKSLFRSYLVLNLDSDGDKTGHERVPQLMCHLPMAAQAPPLMLHWLIVLTSHLENNMYKSISFVSYGGNLWITKLILCLLFLLII